MKILAFVNFSGFIDPRYFEYIDVYNRVGAEFNPPVLSQTFSLDQWPGLKEDVMFLVDITDPENQKYLTRLDPYEKDGTIRQAVIYALAGKFDNLDQKKAQTIWKGGDPSSNGIFEGSALDLPWPRIGIGDLLDKLKQLLSFNWVPWWAWAAVSTISTIKATRSKTVVAQALYGVVSGYSAFRAIKKYNK